MRKYKIKQKKNLEILKDKIKKERHQNILEIREVIKNIIKIHKFILVVFL